MPEWGAAGCRRANRADAKAKEIIPRCGELQVLLRERGGPGGAVASSLGGKKSSISYCRAAAEIKIHLYSPVAELRITHRAPESHSASIPKTPTRVIRCEATL